MHKSLSTDLCKVFKNIALSFITIHDCFYPQYIFVNIIHLLTINKKHKTRTKNKRKIIHK